MTQPPGRQAGGIGRHVLVGVTIALVTFAVVAFHRVTFPAAAICALPLAVLLALSKPTSRAARIALGISLGLSALWLTQATDPPGYVMRAGALWATAMFVALTFFTRLSVTGRALGALGITTVGVTATLPFFQLSWGELTWWAEHRLGMGARTTLGRLWTGIDLTGGSTTPSRPDDVANLLQESVRVIAAIFPALSALIIVLGLAVAAQLYYRIADTPRGTPPQPFRWFKFSEHVGWMAIPPLVFLLVARFAILKPVAANVLVVLGVLYGLRGIAVAIFFLPQLAGGGFLLWILIGTIILLMLPAVLGGAIALGLLDAGLHLRTRWNANSRSLESS